MKKLMLVLMMAFLTAGYAVAVEFQSYRPTEAAIRGYNPDALNAQAPDYQFNGTSSMKAGSYTVPVAALNTDDAMAYGPGSSIGPRRIGHRPEDVGGELPENPNPSDNPDMPIGDTPWLWMIVMMTVFTIMRVRKNNTVE